tara:strand:+ start:665 stop:1060 length:396 start_codon:yes stop_codon:yes gene_type:complete
LIGQFTVTDRRKHSHVEHISRSLAPWLSEHTNIRSNTNRDPARRLRKALGVTQVARERRLNVNTLTGTNNHTFTRSPIRRRMQDLPRIQWPVGGIATHHNIYTGRRYPSVPIEIINFTIADVLKVMRAPLP